MAALQKSKRPRFRSKFEGRVYDAVLDAGLVIEYEPKDLRLQYNVPGIYTPDFRLPNGIIVETKGAFPYEDRRKMIEVMRANPGLDIRLVFMRARNVLRKGSKMSYAQWAEKEGFQWAEGEIPAKWFKEKKK